jgi:hypothetical protein
LRVAVRGDAGATPETAARLAAVAALTRVPVTVPLGFVVALVRAAALQLSN